jgi:hypothetical protein
MHHYASGQDVPGEGTARSVVCGFSFFVFRFHFRFLFCLFVCFRVVVFRCSFFPLVS